MTRVKVCGITNLEDALAALEAGADLLGFNFWKGSSRYVSPETARRIIGELPASVLCVGVFVDEDGPEAVARTAAEGGVGAVQLHGSESPEFCARLGDIKVIKALRVGADFSVERVADYRTDAILLDAYSEKMMGGTGETFDWTLARRARELVGKLYLAGGLTPENVRDAVGEVGPFAVDVCSGVEIAPGRKDAGRVRAFVAAVRSAELKT